MDSPNYVSSHKKDEKLLELTDEHLLMLTDRRWKATLSWTTFHPDEVSKCRDSKGLTALHFACLHKCPAYVVEAILYAAQEIASVPTKSGELPIHWAVRLHANDEILKLLLKASPDCGVVPDSEGETALDILWDRIEERLKNALRSAANNDEVESVRNSCLQKEGWRKIMLILKSYHDSRCHDSETFSPLHTAIQCSCPLSLVQFLCNVYPSCVLQRNRIGRLPLLVAAAALPSKSKKQLFLHLLALDPNAVSVPDYNGCLSLTLAIKSGHHWDNGLKILFDAEPRMLSTRDSKSHMYPFMLVSPPPNCYDDVDGQLHSVETTFQLLRADPSCIRLETV